MHEICISITKPVSIAIVLYDEEKGGIGTTSVGSVDHAGIMFLNGAGFQVMVTGKANPGLGTDSGAQGSCQRRRTMLSLNRL